MIIKIDVSGEIPIYVQLRNEIVKGIGRGEFADGEALPTVRQLASELGVNTMTVSKAYQSLKAEGLLRRTEEEALSCGCRTAADLVTTGRSARSWRENWSF